MHSKNHLRPSSLHGFHLLVGWSCLSTAQGADREHEREMLRVMQAAGTPLPPREVAQRLGAEPKTVSRWLVAARRRGFVERVGGGRYRVVAEVPSL